MGKGRRNKRRVRRKLTETANHSHPSNYRQQAIANSQNSNDDNGKTRNNCSNKCSASFSQNTQVFALIKENKQGSGT
ncbi:hypothetical protein M513_10595 [Trichuris suis]|uniref:Uncharacterized protein n=1 Tax=Trichuris suis TaxID=68888 RepID=A0A085LU72_9BILA|nr:hypothetical protein M513_10595 [Trichuris suis]